MTALDQRGRFEALMTSASRVPEPLGKGPFVLYGAGNRGREVLRVLQQTGHDVATLIDQSVTGSIAGIPIRPLMDPEVAALAKNGCTAIVSIFNPGVDPLPIHETLRTVGFTRVVGLVELRQITNITDAYWLSTSETMSPSHHEAGWLFDRLADDVSREMLSEAVTLRKTCLVEQLRMPTPTNQYSPDGVPLPRTGVRFVDGGAFDGDTVAHLLAAGFEVEALAAFEPDPKNYADLCRRVSGCGLRCEVSLWPCGLDESTRQVRFRGDGLASSGIADGGELVIQTVALDDAMPDFCPSYVKLDIEGAEAAALRGMAKTIDAARPALAVCVYHKPADLWELPRLVDALLPNAAFFLRSHAWNGFDLVLYAVPQERVNA